MPTDSTPAPQNRGRGRIHRNIKPMTVDPDDDCDMDSMPDPPSPKGKASTGTVAASYPKPRNGPPIKGGSLFDQPDEDEEENEEDEEDSLSTVSHEGLISPSMIALLAKKESLESSPHTHFNLVSQSGAGVIVGKQSTAINEYTNDDSEDSSLTSKDFASSEFVSADSYAAGTFVPNWVKQVCENGNEMIVLAQLAYWFRRGPKGIRAGKLLGEAGYYWAAKSYSDLANETGLKATQVRHAVETLATRGIIVHQARQFGRLIINHYRIDPCSVEEAIVAGDDE